MTSPALTYGSYLALDELLAVQRPKSDEHDELLFIVVHQVYELWFKQLLHEGAYLQARLERGETSAALGTLRRKLTILKTMVAQIDVLETMTPQQFLRFRPRLEASSGFQSAQFREFEALLGRRDDSMLRPYADDSHEYLRISRALARPSLFDSFSRYLHTQGYPLGSAEHSPSESESHDPSSDLEPVILQAYRDEGDAAQVAEHMVDLDEGVMEWRYRHVQMVRRTIGDRRGSGGSEGVAYLAGTLLKPSFPDLWTIRSAL